MSQRFIGRFFFYDIIEHLIQASFEMNFIYRQISELLWVQFHNKANTTIK